MSEAEITSNIASGVDQITRRKCGKLAVYGLVDTQIADALMLSVEQVIAIKLTTEYKAAFSEAAVERIDRNIDLEDGWDVVEEKALQGILEQISFNRDPRFLLMAGRVANQAKRRTPTNADRPIDAMKAGNTIVLTLNQRFVNGAQSTENHASIDITPKPTMADVPMRKQIDMPTPKRISEILNINNDKSELRELADEFQMAGIDLGLPA